MVFNNAFSVINHISFNPSETKIAAGCNQKDGDDLRGAVCLFDLKPEYFRKEGSSTTSGYKSASVVYFDDQLTQSDVDYVKFLDENTILSKGVTDKNIAVWRAKKKVEMLKKFNRPLTNVFFIKMFVKNNGLDFLIIDPRSDGSIAFYNEGSTDPFQVYHHPDSDKLLMNVCLSNDGKFLVATAENNVVLIHETSISITSIK
jgi:WD40 repeat protein